MIDGLYSDPAMIIAFNTAEGWARDFSAEFADEIAYCYLIKPTTAPNGKVIMQPRWLSR